MDTLCAFCKKQTKKKYCGRKCEFEHILQRKKARYRICRICEKPITDSSKTLHEGRCSEIAKKQATERKAITRIKNARCYERTCACGDVFQTYNKLHIYCSNKTCRNKRLNESRVKSRLLKKDMPVIPKIKQKLNQKNIFLNFVKIQAQCPKCSIRHDVKAVAGSTKWIYCASCRNTVFSGNYDNRMDVEGCRQAML